MFGIAIILFTILIRIVTWPLNAQQMKGAAAMQSLQNDKDWQDIQKKYAKDKEKLAQEQMRIYREKGINPFGSCLPTLIQFPIIIALYQSITRALASTPFGLLEALPQRQPLWLSERYRADPAQQQIPVDGPGTARRHSLGTWIFPSCRMAFLFWRSSLRSPPTFRPS